MSMPPRPPRRGGSIAFAFVLAMGLAVALAAGAAFSGIATGAVQNMLRTAGGGPDDAIKAEQQRQAAALATIERSLDIMRGEVARLTARVEARNPGPELADIDLSALRSSLDEHEEHDRGAFNAVKKRIDWLETLIYSQDVTSSVSSAVPAPSAGASRQRVAQQPAARWQILYAEDGVAVIASKDGAIDVTVGFVIPDLGRVTAIRQRDARWEVVTEKGTISER
jgi:hypothetical protein